MKTKDDRKRYAFVSTKHPRGANLSVKMNRYSVVKVDGFAVPNLEPSGSGEQQPSLRLTARDRDGRIGKHTETFYLDGHPAILLDTNKILYRVGEAVEVALTRFIVR